LNIIGPAAAKQPPSRTGEKRTLFIGIPGSKREGVLFYFQATQREGEEALSHSLQ
jgi:hypothetical protein